MSKPKILSDNNIFNINFSIRYFITKSSIEILLNLLEKLINSRASMPKNLSLSYLVLNLTKFFSHISGAIIFTG